MHKEYAVDPGTIAASWDSFLYLIEKFGFHKGRVISQFPRKWEEMVMRSAESLLPVAKKRLEVKLVSVRDQVLVKSGRHYEQMGSWLKSALESHKAQPFHAVLTDCTDALHSLIIKRADCDEAHPLLAVSTARDVARLPDALASAARFLLQNSRKIKFVDPYFDPSREKWLKTLKAFVSLSVDGGRKNLVDFEYHYCEKENARPTQPTAEEFKQKCGSWLRDVLANRASVVFYRWRERPRGELFHARYILTERGGLKFDVGLDAGREGETTPVFLVDPIFITEILEKLKRAAIVYELIEPVIQVDSSGQVTEVSTF
jgi:hypothetical protein